MRNCSEKGGRVKRTLRWLLNGLTALSLLVALVVAGSWVRSYWRTDNIHLVYAYSQSKWRLINFKGRIEISEWRLTTGIWVGDLVEHYTSDARVADKLKTNLIGIEWQVKEYFIVTRFVGKQLSIPHAYLLLFFSTLPLVCLYHHLRRSFPYPHGQCVKCGYDLRATPDRCPECGTISAKKNV